MNKTIGVIALSRLKIACIIGCLPNEREREQEIVIDLKLTLPLPQIDSIHDTVDYERVAQLVIACAQLGKFFLIETLAQKVVDELLHAYPLLQKVWIKVIKPQAVIGTESCNCEVEKYKT